MAEHAVVIAGGGPTGLMLAGELALAGVDVVIVERRTTQVVDGSRGGQGLNTGVQDAVNLGWKLAQVVDTTSLESLLDTYHAERHPVGARVLHNTMAQVALVSPGDRHQALRDIMNELVGMDEPRRRIAGMLSGLDIHYDSERGTRCSGAACRTSTSSPPVARRTSSPCSTTPTRCC